MPDPLALIWPLILIQIALGGFDVLFHHEGTERLAWRPSQRRELWLHAARNILYAAIFAILGWSAPQGILALGLIVVLVIEVAITLWDFVEEDLSRHLPATERITHTLLALNYGAILILLVPALWVWSGRPTGIDFRDYGWWSAMASLAALGCFLFGLREIAAARRLARLAPRPAETLSAGLIARKHILVTGGTGFIGRRLVQALVAGGHDVTVLTRTPGKADLPAPIRLVSDLAQIPNDTRIDAIVNLAGEPLANGLWTTRKQRKILRSRLTMTRNVVGLCARLRQPPEVLINGSAVGWYGLNDEDLDIEESFPGRPCFTQRVCAAWETAAERAAPLGVRVVRLRTGLVLGTDGGMLANLLTPTEFGLGGPMGDGRHWMPWIERDDLVRLIVHAIATPALSGPLNATAPNPVRNADFALALGKALHRPVWVRLPAAPLRAVLGGFADELLLGGQKVIPAKAIANGFRFRHTHIEGALQEMLGAPSAPTNTPETFGPATEAGQMPR